MDEETKKLRVPDPDETPSERGDDDPMGTLVLAAVLSILCGLGIFVLQQRRSSHSTAQSTSSREARSSESATDRGPRPRRQLAERLVKQSTDQLDSRDWSIEERLAAFQFGPRRVAEAACRALPTPLDSFSLPTNVQRVLIRGVERRVDHAPWSCLIRYVLEGDIDHSLGLFRVLETVWREIFVFRGPPDIVTSVLEDYRQSDDPPDNPAFDRWLRLCGLNFNTPEGEACRRLLRALAPEQGRDLLDVVEVHLRRVDLNPSYDLPYLLDGLARLAESGQPDTWRIESTEALPGYDADLRLGAILYLCRIVHSPRSDTARRAARALSQGAGLTTRAVHQQLRDRWRLACKRAFRVNKDPDAPRAPLLDVWSGEEHEPPHYALKRVIDSDDCRIEDDKPRWYCASRQWRGHRADKLREFFFRTESLKWQGEDHFWNPQ